MKSSEVSRETVAIQIENKDHYTIGLSLPELERELCALLTHNYVATGGIEEAMPSLLGKSKHIIPSKKSFPLGICFGAFMPVIKDYILSNDLYEVVGSPWTILIFPEDGPIHFQGSQMYDGSMSIHPKEIQ